MGGFHGGVLIILTLLCHFMIQVYGIVRHRGADMEWHKCELEKPELYEDHTCTTLEDLKPMNCKRSKWELERKGAVEDCR